MNKTKLIEKSTRIPDTRRDKWDESLKHYLNEVEALNNEMARSHRFTSFLSELNINPDFIEKYCKGIEKYLKAPQKDRILKGRADNLFGNIILEFERSILKNRLEAEEQLRKYTSILWTIENTESRTPFIGIATDCVRFLVYSPKSQKTIEKEITPGDVDLNLIEEADWSKIEPYEVFNWIDRYFCRKEILHPTSEGIVRDFGGKSHAFQTVTKSLLSLWQEIKEKSEFQVFYSSWEKYLRIVYGSDVAADELFICHTYLANLAKLISWKRLTDSIKLPEKSEIIEILEGQFFKKQGIENFIEEDFFSWIAREKALNVGINITKLLFSLLQNYNLRELSEDVLKSLYQELVDPETRHDLGEYYTPDWLAHRMVNKLLDENPQGSIFDPACGSGTFLYLAIKEKRERLQISLKTLNHIFESVYGADVHPLAVNIAKTNYVLALGDLLKKRKVKLTIPIYLTDTIKLPERWMRSENADYRININGKEIDLSEDFLQNPILYDQAIELAKDFAKQNKNYPISMELFQKFLKAQNFSGVNNEELLKNLFEITKVLKDFIDSDKDTIWSFVLKNSYKPLFFKQKFDFIVGNPPWIAFRFMEPEYQKFLKREITQNYRLLIGKGHLITHIEIATLFLVRTADLYLKKDGTIAFVMPKSLFYADQHDDLRRGNFIFSENSVRKLLWKEIWDCEKVVPLFNVPSCVLISNKDLAKTLKYPVKGKILKGKLNRKNASLEESENIIKIEEVEWSLNIRGKHSFWSTEKGYEIHKESFYKNKFYQGAAIVPRSFWFVEIKTSPIGFNPDLPLLETSERAQKEAKNAYKNIYFKDNVEKKFLYATLLSTDLLPFGHLDYRLVVLPIEKQENQYQIIDSEAAKNLGFIHLSNWLNKVESEWIKGRSSKANNINSIEWLNYRSKLTKQNPFSKFKVIYNTSGTFLTSAIVENKRYKFIINGQKIQSQGFIADTKTYYFEIDDIVEALYIVAILNSPMIDKLLKPMQSRGLWGPRDIHKKVFEFPIPKFDETNHLHIELSELGDICTKKVSKWLNKGGQGDIKSIGKLRGMVRELLKEDLKRIDNLVEKILK